MSCSGKILLKFLPHLFKQWVRTRKYHGVQSFAQVEEFPLEHSSIGKFQHADTPARRAREHRTDGCCEPDNVDDLRSLRLRRRCTEHRTVAVGKTAEGFVSAFECGIGDGAAFVYTLKRGVDPQHALIGMKRHLMMLLEPPPDLAGLNAALTEIGIFYFLKGIPPYLLDEFEYESRSFIPLFHGTA